MPPSRSRPSRSTSRPSARCSTPRCSSSLPPSSSACSAGPPTGCTAANRRGGRRMTASRKILLALAILALAQTGVLAAMVIDRVQLLTVGARDRAADRARRPARPLPRRVRAARLRRRQVPMRLLDGPAPARQRGRSTSCWRRRRRALDDRQDVPPKPREPRPTASCSRRARPTWPASDVSRRGRSVRYGIESYFVPEGQGRRLEDLAREKQARHPGRRRRPAAMPPSRA